MFRFDFYSGAKVSEIENGLKDGTFSHKKKTTKIRSDIWLQFDHIYTRENEIVNYFYFCTKCESVLDNISSDGNTNRLKRHRCQDDDEKIDSKKYMGTKTDRESLKKGAVNFVSKDFRPYYAVEGEGFFDICTACMEFGQKNRHATREDLIKNLPSRNTVKEGANFEANEKRIVIGKLMKQAIENGGISATTDTWTDDYRKNTYIAVVAHMCIKTESEIEYYRFNLSVSEVNEAVKTGNREILNQ